MPKDRRGRSVSRDRYRASPYPCSSSHTKRPSPKFSSETEENVKEWEEVRCPVCLEHPHNAVLLICSSYEKGCRPYMCDTSYRHSNCLDQYCKSFSGEESPTTPPEGEAQIPDVPWSAPESIESTIAHVHHDTIPEVPPTMNPATCEHEAEPKLLCPLCRGEIKDWIIVEPARCFMNAKSRNCSCETCSFSGTYADLRKHARLDHPQARPSEADPERQRTWRTLERQRDIGDLLSTLEPSIVGGDDIRSRVGGGFIFLLIRVVRPGSSSRSSSWSGTTRTRAQISIRRRTTRLWGESYEGETGSHSEEEDGEASDGSSGARRRNEPSDARMRNASSDGGSGAGRHNESSDGGTGLMRQNEASDGGSSAGRRNESSGGGTGVRRRNVSSEGGTGVRRRNEPSDGGTGVRRRSERLRRRATPENQP